MCPSSLREGTVVADPDFEKLVQQFAEAEAASAVNWDEIRDRWIQQVRELFDQIEVWLSPLIVGGTVQVSRPPRILMEEDLGTYTVQSLLLQLASRKLVLEPIGTMLIGAFGRIEATGPNGTAVLLLLNTDKTLPPQDRWQSVSWFISYPSSQFLPRPRPIGGQSLPPISRSESRPLTQDSFQQLFADLFGIRR